ncbi:MAG: chlorite dismutase family protein [Elusimicrobia bacterium]|nr:chlorite dismutase family protein [Elusimicrobiota bacterium]
MTTQDLPDLRERGGAKNGQPQFLDRRLFMQLQAFTGCRDSRPLVRAVSESGLEAVCYEDVNDPSGVGVLAMSEEPELFLTTWRQLLNREPFSGLSHKPELAMLGRTYSLGYEPNLENWLIGKPRRTVLDPDWPWALWYPLRRTGAFSRLSHQEQGQILREHGIIGRSFGDAGFGRDIRLASMGLDKNDNDFTIGLVGRELFPLSALVQAMRATVQTSTYIQAMGPFFVGRAVWQSELKPEHKEARP